MRGTGYAVAEIVWWLLIAAAIGFLIGWILRKWSMGAHRGDESAEQLAAEQTQAAELETRLAALEEKRAEQQTALREAQEKVVALRADVEAKSLALDAAMRMPAASQGTGQADKVAELEALIAERDAQLAATEAALAAATASASGRDTHATSSNVPAADTASLPGAPASAASPEGGPTDLPDKGVAMAMVAEIAARTRGDGSGVDDDLQAIRGIGPKLARTLKELGITSFKQIARFTTEDIAYITAALDAFPGRIERDDWMASAAAAHLEKYGEPV